MVTLTTADSALKTVYLDVLRNELNINANPFYAKIKKTSNGVYGKEVKVLAPYGVNGGIAALSEDSQLPTVGANNYVTLTGTLKNLYGRIEITDKAVRASQSNAGEFVNLLNDEMQNLVKSSTYNLSRMLYGTGEGFLGEIKSISGDKKTVTLDTVAGIADGMIVGLFDDGIEEYVAGYTTMRVVSVNRANKMVTLDTALNVEEITMGGFHLTVQNSYENEITGLETKPYVMGGGTYARKLPNAMAFGLGGVPRREGAPVLEMAPGHGGAHEPDEKLEIQNFLDSIKVFTMAVLALNDAELSE